MSRPKARHTRRQRRLRKLLEGFLESRGIVNTELPFRALPEHELRAADVAFVTSERWKAVDDNDVLHGAPEIVIEILSPSNSAIEMAERCAIGLQNGSVQFWTADDRNREIKVSTPDGITRTYKSGDSIPLPFVEDQSLAVDAVFAE